MKKKLEIIVCEENRCGREIGFVSRKGYRHYDDGTIQNGWHFFCEKHGDKKDPDVRFPLIES